MSLRPPEKKSESCEQWGVQGEIIITKKKKMGIPNEYVGLSTLYSTTCVRIGCLITFRSIFILITSHISRALISGNKYTHTV